MGLARRHLVLAVAGLAAVSGVPEPVSGAVRTRTLAVPDQTQPTVEIRLARVGPGPRKGGVGLLIRNRETAPRQLRIRYTSALARPHYNVRATVRSSRGTFRGSVTRAPGLVARVGPRDIADLGLRVVARRGAPPEELRGRLVILSELPGTGVAAGRPLVLRVRGVRSEERLVTVTPKRVTLPVTLLKVRWDGELELIPQDHGEAFVDLHGPGATALVNRRDEVDVVLRRDDGRSFIVSVKIMQRPDSVARLVIPGTSGDDEAFRHPGQYKGRLPLGPGRSAPTVLLTVNVKYWLGLAIGVVLLGVVLGRMVPPLLKLERVRRKGRTAIADAIRRFGAVRPGRDKPASYDLDSLITPQRWERRGLLRPPHDEPARLLRALKDGRDEADLNATAKEAEELRGQVERWARLETSARQLLDQLEERPPRRASGRFAKTRPYTDGFQVLADLQTPPAGGTKDDVAKVGDLCARAYRECKVVQLSAELWILHGQLEGVVPIASLPEEVQAELAEAELGIVWRGAGSPRTRDAIAFNKLTARLENSKIALEELRDQFIPPPRPRTRRQRFSAARVRAWTWGKATTPRVLLAPLLVLKRMILALLSPLRGWFGFVEAFSVLLSLAVPVLVYVVTLYDDTWGSPLDFISAFAVGFAGKVALDFGTNGLILGTRQVSGSTPSPAEEALKPTEESMKEHGTVNGGKAPDKERAPD